MSQTPELKLQIAQIKMEQLKNEFRMLQLLKRAELKDKNEGETFVYKQICDLENDNGESMLEVLLEIQELTQTVAEGDPE
jgi:hypothetical protein